MRKDSWKELMFFVFLPLGEGWMEDVDKEQNHTETVRKATNQADNTQEEMFEHMQERKK